MKRIYGRVLVKETNIGIPDLLVAVYDVDLGGAEPKQRELALHEQAAFHHALPNRLGSVLTDERGNFDLPFDETLIKHYGTDRVPDLVLAIFAPEDSDGPTEPRPLPEAKRLLHLSRAPRFNAGMVEAWIVRIAKKDLDAFAIPISASTGVAAEADVAKYATAVTRQWKVKDEIKAQLGTQLRARAKLRDIAQNKAKVVFKKLRAVSPALKGSPYLVGPDRTTEDAHAAAIDAGMKRIARHTGSLTLNLTSNDVTTLGLTTQPSGEISGSVAPERVAARMSSGNPTMDLSRVRDLQTTCRALEASKTLDAPTGTTSPDPTPTNPTPTDGSTTVTHDSAQATILDRVIGQIDELAKAGPPTGKRPTLDDLRKDLEAFRPKGGPADATAFHDFNVLQVAFKHVWAHAFDENLRSQAEAVYLEATRLADEANIEMPPFDEIEDVNALKDFLKKISLTVGTTPSTPTGDKNCIAASDAVRTAFPDAVAKWSTLSQDEQLFVSKLADEWSTADDQKKKALENTVASVLLHPTGPGGRLAGLMLELGKMMQEPYAFDVFAANTYNFGILLTYRQRWDPKDYQVGDLVATIPLAPGETRKFSKKRVIKKSRAEREAEKSIASRSTQTSDTMRAEAEIMRKASTATNFKLTSHGSFNIGIGSIDAMTEFALDQQQHSSALKKDFHEATLKAAEDFRQERSLEIDTNKSEELEETSSGEISNPNNEITVTYMFYELQRVYDVTEQIHRARPVILVAQDVPAPHEIDEAWLIANQWILSRVLLDDSLRPALDYLTSGLAGDEVGIEVLKAAWEAQANLVSKLESLVDAQLAQRTSLREYLIGLHEKEEKTKSMEMPLAAKIFTLGLAPDPADISANMLEASAKAGESRLKYVEEALADAQKKLTDASAAFNQITKDYSTALQRKFSRRVAIDQLRLHVKQNILHYMQAIWDHEPPDQRFFRLYNKKVKWFAPGEDCELVATSPPPAPSWKHAGIQAIASTRGLAMHSASMQMVHFDRVCRPAITAEERELVEIADLDNPLGYKGNYIIFPLKESCYLTTYMLSEFVDEYFGVRDPDEAGNYSIEDLERYVKCVLADTSVSESDKSKIKEWFIDMLTRARPTTDQVIVPTGQLFIEALPGAHPLLEDFKLLHRIEDVRKVKADVRHAELENLRLASRLVAGKLADPDIEKQVIVGKDVAVDVTDG
jgi:hypothetical protein